MPHKHINTEIRKYIQLAHSAAAAGRAAAAAACDAQPGATIGEAAVRGREHDRDAKDWPVYHHAVQGTCF